jgi:hypothetical protein
LAIGRQIKAAAAAPGEEEAAMSDSGSGETASIASYQNFIARFTADQIEAEFAGSLEGGPTPALSAVIDMLNRAASHSSGKAKTAAARA